ncbi:MAG: efflux RND transporter permease subunit [Gemmataceae bacterium]
MIRFFAKHPTAANLLMVVFIVGGVLTLGNLRRETFPDFSSDKVQITIPYRGATAEEVEEGVCIRVEDALDEVTFINEIISDAREGLAIITVEMQDGGDFLKFKDEIDTAVRAIDDFPKDVEEPVLTELNKTDQVLSILVAGEMSPPDLKAYCEDFRRRMKQEAGVSLAVINGFSDHQFRVELSNEALQRFGLSVDDVRDKIGKQNVTQPVGGLETPGKDILVRFVDERRSTRQLEDLVVKESKGGAAIRVRDVGQVVDLFELDEDKVMLNGQRAALVKILKTKNQDTIRVAEQAKEFLEEEKQRYPCIQYAVTNDFSILVQDRLSLLTKNGWQGMILVFLTMWLFFNFRLAFWVVASLPVAFLGAFVLLPYFGLTINMLTMVGLLLALGLLMDDGIVIAENIATHLEQGKAPMQAAIDGVKQVAAGVFSSFVTTACVLGPLAFITGDLGKVLKVVPVILLLVLAVSLIEAFWILPSHLGHSLPRHEPKKKPRFRQFFDSCISWVRDNVVGRSIDLLLRWRYLWIGVVLLIFLLSLGMLVGGVLRFQAFPDLDGDLVVARLQLPQGTPLKRTEEVVGELTKAAKKVNEKFKPSQPDRQDLVQMVYVKYNENKDTQEAGPHVATVYINLLSAEKRSPAARIDDILTAWRQYSGDPADVESVVYTEPTLGPAGRPLEIRVQGPNLERNNIVANRIKEWLSEFTGVYNLSTDLRRGKLELRLRLREGAVGEGFDAKMVAGQLRSAFQGTVADEIQVGTEPYEIDVRLRQADQSSWSNLDNFRFTTLTGKSIPISAIATIEEGRGWSRVSRVNGQRAVTILGDVDPEKTNTERLVKLLKKEVLQELEDEFPEVDIAFEGEIANSAETQASMSRAFIVGLLGVFILLSFQFRSYLEPFVVMLAIPLAFIGVVWGHFVMGLDLSIPSVFGFASLAGIVVNDSILLVLFLKKSREEGADILSSAAQASRDRFRAITLTSLTTIAGLLPLVFERSLQAQVLIPLAVSVASGLLASTVLVLLVIPCLYAILGDFGLVSKLVREDDHETVTDDPAADHHVTEGMPTPPGGTY